MKYVGFTNPVETVFNIVSFAIDVVPKAYKLVVHIDNCNKRVAAKKRAKAILEARKKEGE